MRNLRSLEFLVEAFSAMCTIISVSVGTENLKVIGEVGKKHKEFGGIVRYEITSE